MARIKGNTNPTVSFKNGAASLVDLGAYLVSFEVADGDATQVTWSDFATGTAPKALNIEFVLDFAAAGAYEYMYANKGATGVTYTFIPDGGSAISQTNPKFTGTCTLGAAPNFSAAAGTDQATFTVTVQCDTFTKAIS